MLTPGEIVIVDFPGAVAIKRRPSIVMSTTLYHTHRPDIIVGLLITHIAQATTPTDYVLRDWATAGLRHPSALGTYLLTLDAPSLPSIGHLSERDWHGVQACLARAIAVPQASAS